MNQSIAVQQGQQPVIELSADARATFISKT